VCDYAHLEVPGNATQAYVVRAKVGCSAVEDVRGVELVPAHHKAGFHFGTLGQDTSSSWDLDAEVAEQPCVTTVKIF